MNFWKASFLEEAGVKTNFFWGTIDLFSEGRSYNSVCEGDHHRSGIKDFCKSKLFTQKTKSYSENCNLFFGFMRNSLCTIFNCQSLFITPSERFIHFISSVQNVQRLNLTFLVCGFVYGFRKNIFHCI